LSLKESVLSRPGRRVLRRLVNQGVFFLSGLPLIVAPAMLVLAGVPAAQAQSSAPSGTQSSDSKLPPPPTIDPNVNRNLTLADVRYDNKYDVYGGIGSYHANAGPQLIGGANLGGFDVQGTRWFTPHLGLTANARGDYGTIGVAPNPYLIKGPFIMEHMGLGGVSYRLKQGKPAALVLHSLFGVDYGTFNHALGNLPPPASGPVPPAAVGLFNNQAVFAMALGGSLDLNRSPQLAFRISPDYVYTDFGGIAQNEFAISVGILYRLKFPKGAFKPRSQ
jgi:hypothetical protein